MYCLRAMRTSKVMTTNTHTIGVTSSGTHIQPGPLLANARLGVINSANAQRT